MLNILSDDNDSETMSCSVFDNQTTILLLPGVFTIHIIENNVR